MFIQNVSMGAIQIGLHRELGDKNMLIQIVDPYEEFPIPRYANHFDEIHKFQFHDITKEIDGYVCISDEQAERLAKLLQHAFDSEMNVIVHCHAGLCRSGAVAEIGVMMGFEDTGAHRIPNIAIKSKMMKVLGWSYD